MCMFDGDGGVVLSDEHPRARKAHRCGECGRRIEPGETYRKTSVIGDGFYSGKTCAHCEPAAEWLLKNCHGYIFGGVHEDLREHVLCGAVPTFGAVARMTVGIARGWRRFDGAGLMPIPDLGSV